MANIPKFIDHIRDILVVLPDLTSRGVGKTHIYRQFAPQLKDPSAPHVILSYEIDKRDVGLDIDDFHFYVKVHIQERAQDAEIVGKAVIDALHNHKYSDNNIVVHKMFDVGGPVQPWFDKELNHWEAIMEFEVSLG